MTRARDKANSTVSNFASTGIDDNADANAITIDSSENVGIGVTSMSAKTVINQPSSSDALIIQRAAGVSGNTTFSFPSANSQIAGTNHIILSAGGSERLRIRDSGGITFNGDTAAANALDDYEEGNFTVTISSGISVSSYDHQLGHYVKVGRQVTAWVFMEYNGSSRTGSHFVISGLPFNTSDDNTTESTFGGFIGYQNGFSNTNNIVHVPRGTNLIQFYEVDGSTLIGSELSGASGEIRVVVQYTVP